MYIYCNVLDNWGVDINKIINEQQPRVVYCASYYGGKWLLMMTTGFCTFNRVGNIIAWAAVIF